MAGGQGAEEAGTSTSVPVPATPKRRGRKGKKPAAAPAAGKKNPTGKTKAQLDPSEVDAILSDFIPSLALGSASSGTATGKGSNPKGAASANKNGDGDTPTPSSSQSFQGTTKVLRIVLEKASGWFRVTY